VESRYLVELSGREVSILVRATQADLATLRICERTYCTCAVLNGITDLKNILMVMSNHIASMHPAADEDVTEVKWSAWLARFERWQLSCKISDKAVENRILKAIPNQLADQICVGLKGKETKAELLAKIKDTIVKKRSVFLYRADLHRIVQNCGEAPERYAA
jgi:hypothetical protein